MNVSLDKTVICPILIGRTRELAALYSLIDVDSSVQSHAALISGEAGIGKSRLVAEARNSAFARGFLLLQGSCFQADTSYPYAPLLDLLRAFFANHLPALLTENGPESPVLSKTGMNGRSFRAGWDGGSSSLPRENIQ